MMAGWPIPNLMLDVHFATQSMANPDSGHIKRNFLKLQQFAALYRCKARSANRLKSMRPLHCRAKSCLAERAQAAQTGCRP